MHQGRYAGRLLPPRLRGRPDPKPFRYFDRVNTAVVGKGFAVLQTGKGGGLHLSGLLAWCAWAGIQLQFLASANLRESVFLAWLWIEITGRRGDRLIVTPHRPEFPAWPAVRSPTITLAVVVGGGGTGHPPVSVLGACNGTTPAKT